MRSLLGYLYFDSQISGYTPNLSNVSDMLRNIQRIDKKKPSPVEKMFEALDKELPDNYACGSGSCSIITFNPRHVPVS